MRVKLVEKMEKVMEDHVIKIIPIIEVGEKDQMRIS